MNQLLMAAICKTVAAWYTALVGAECDAMPFAVRKCNACGYYFVHRLGSADFYEVHIKRIDNLSHWGLPYGAS